MGRAARCNSRKEGRVPHRRKALPSFYLSGKEDAKLDVFIQIVQSVGFPIAVAIAMFIMLKNEQDAHKEESSQIRDAVFSLKTEFTEAIHRLESQTTEAINNNTLVMQKLLDKLEEK